MACALPASPAYASGTPAGTRIDNVATATFDGAGGTRSVTSNQVSLRVDELLDVVVASADPGPVSARDGELRSVLRFRVTNAGNGPEAFALGVMGRSEATTSIRPLLRSSSIATATARTIRASTRRI